MQKIGIIGGGAWGTALAATTARAGRDVIIWAREQGTVDNINRLHANPDFLPGISIPESVRATPSPAEACAADAVLLVPPAQHLRATCEACAPGWPAGTPAVICAKGIEQKTGSLLSDIVRDTLPADTPIAVLSGPTFAAEVAAGHPTAVTLACENADTGEQLVQALGTLTFRPYISCDITGVQIGGAVKNVMAIASGIVEGASLGDNARAALITRSLAEIGRLAEAMGGDAATLSGLSGLGDLVLTANSFQSRNFSLGVALGKGTSLEDYLAGRKSVAEGMHTASALRELADRMKVDMPVAQAINRILNRKGDLETEIQRLLSRPFRHENPEA